MAPAEPGRVVGEPARGVPVRGCFVAGPITDLRLPPQALGGRGRRGRRRRRRAGAPACPKVSGSDSQPAPIRDTPHTTGVPMHRRLSRPGPSLLGLLNPAVGSRLSAAPALTLGGGHRSSRIRLFWPSRLC
jgi:hypothetical protein